MNLVALVLAAGAGRRFGGDKLSARFNGEPLVAHAIRAARAAPVARVVVVAAPGLGVGEWPGAPPVEVLPIASGALSESLRAGIARAGEVGAEGAFVFLGDMPLVPHAVAPRLARLLGGHYAAVPREGGRSGHPVLLSRRAFADVAGIEGDRGAGGLLARSDDVVFDECTDECIHLDVDRVEDIARLESKEGHGDEG